MALPKNQLFDEIDLESAVIGKALSHPARIAILRKLAASNRCICGDIVDEVPLAQATVSQHLKALKAAGFIIGEIDGPRMCYCINWERLNQAFESVQVLADQLKANSVCC